MKLTRLGRVSHERASSAGRKATYFSLSPSYQSWSSRALTKCRSWAGQPCLTSRIMDLRSGVSSPGYGSTTLGEGFGIRRAPMASTVKKIELAPDEVYLQEALKNGRGHL